MILGNWCCVNIVYAGNARTSVQKWRWSPCTAVGTARALVSLNIQAKDTDVIGRIETKQNNSKQGYIKVTRKWKPLEASRPSRVWDLIKFPNLNFHVPKIVVHLYSTCTHTIRASTRLSRNRPIKLAWLEKMRVNMKLTLFFEPDSCE